MNDDEFFEMTDNFLEHHGVKGMRWGVRKNRYQKKYERDLARTAKKVQNTPTAKVTIKGPPRDEKGTYVLTGRQFVDSMIQSYGGTSLRQIKRGETKLWKRRINYVDALMADVYKVPVSTIKKAYAGDAYGPRSKVKIQVGRFSNKETIRNATRRSRR